MTDLLSRTNPGPPPPASPAGGPSRYRSVWLVPGILLTAAGLLVVVQLIRGLLGGGWSATTVSEQQTYSEPVSRIEIYTDNGNVELVADSGDDVVVERRTRASPGTPRYDEQVIGDTLRLDALCPNSNWFVIGSTCEVHYRVQVPTGVEVSVRTDAGDLIVRDLDGAVDLNSDAGDMYLSGLSGEVVAYTDAGNIEGTDFSSGSVDVTSDAGDLHLEFEQAPDEVSAQTDAGDIVVLLPEQDSPDGSPISYLVEAATDAGTVAIDVAQDGATRRTITAFSDAGDVRIGYRGGTPND